MAASRTRVLHPWGVGILAHLVEHGISKQMLLTSLNIDPATFYRWLAKPPSNGTQHQLEMVIHELARVPHIQPGLNTSPTGHMDSAGATAGFRAVLADAVARGQVEIAVQSALYWLDSIEAYQREMAMWKLHFVEQTMLDQTDPPLVIVTDRNGCIQTHTPLLGIWKQIFVVAFRRFGTKTVPAGTCLSDLFGAAYNDLMCATIHRILHLNKHLYYRRTYVDRSTTPPTVYPLLWYGVPFAAAHTVLFLGRNLQRMVASRALLPEPEADWLPIPGLAEEVTPPTPAPAKPVRAPTATAPAARSRRRNR